MLVKQSATSKAYKSLDGDSVSLLFRERSNSAAVYPTAAGSNRVVVVLVNLSSNY